MFASEPVPALQSFRYRSKCLLVRRVFFFPFFFFFHRTATREYLNFVFIRSSIRPIGALAQDGRSRCLDEDAAGYVRSEAVAVVFLQRAKSAKRIYATVVHVKTNCDGYKEEGIMFPSRKMQSVLFEEFYKECGVPITSVSYVEAHGTGTRVGDPVEMNAINQIFTKGRTDPLKVGTIKSNIGHTEAASGISSLIKVNIVR